MVLVAEHLLGEWSFTTEMAENIIVGFLTPVVLHDTKWLYAFSDTVRNRLADLPLRPSNNTGSAVQWLAGGVKPVVIDLGHARSELDRLSLVGIARCIRDHDAHHLDPPLAYLASFRRFLTSDEWVPLPLNDYFAFDDQPPLNAKSLLKAMSTSTLSFAARKISWFDASPGRRYLIIMPDQTDFTAINTIDEYNEYVASPHRYVVDHRHQRADWKGVRSCAVRERELTTLRNEVRTTRTADELRAQMQAYAVAFQAAGLAARSLTIEVTEELLDWMRDYAARTAGSAPSAAVKATLRGVLFYFVTKELGGSEPGLIGITEAIVEFLMHTAFPSARHAASASDPDDLADLQQQKASLDLQIAIEKAKQELAALKRESEH
ncbi:MAG: hypothetical protein AABO58_16490 [Acidobacteriota bacterium]